MSTDESSGGPSGSRVYTVFTKDPFDWAFVCVCVCVHQTASFSQKGTFKLYAQETDTIHAREMKMMYVCLGKLEKGIYKANPIMPAKNSAPRKFHTFWLFIYFQHNPFNNYKLGVSQYTVNHDIKNCDYRYRINSTHENIINNSAPASGKHTKKVCATMTTITVLLPICLYFYWDLRQKMNFNNGIIIC